MLPCSGSGRGVDVKVMKDKKIVKSLEDVRRPQLIRLNGTQPGERYIIRVMDAVDSGSNSNWPALESGGGGGAASDDRGSSVEVMMK